jgi:hypothetical protein
VSLFLCLRLSVVTLLVVLHIVIVVPSLEFHCCCLSISFCVIMLPFELLL